MSASAMLVALSSACAATMVRMPALAEQSPSRVARLGHAVGVQHEHIACVQVDAAVLDVDVREGAEDRAARGHQPCPVPGAVDPQWRVVAAAREGEVPAGEVERRIQRGHEQAGSAVVDDVVIGAPQHLRRGRGDRSPTRAGPRA